MLRLRELREKAGIRQDTLSAAIGCGRNTISRYETGDREPDALTLQKLADYFGVSVDYLLGRTEDLRERPAQNPPLALEGMYLRLAQKAQAMRISEHDMNLLLEAFEKFRHDRTGD